MATYFVTQAGAGAADGTSLANAFSAAGHNSATFAAGDVIYIAGQIDSSLAPPSSGTEGNPITYRFDWPGSPGTLQGPASGTTLNHNGRSHVVYERPVVTGGGTTAGILLAGTTAGVVINQPILTVGNTRGIYILGNAHTNWEINNPQVSVGAGEVTSDNDFPAIQVWGNNATAGTGGKIINPVLRGTADSFAATASNFIGLHVDDWNSMTVEGLDAESFHTGLRVTNADSNRVRIKRVARCTNGGLKSDSTGGGQGVLIELTSTANEIFGGEFDGNFQNYLDASSAGGNKFWGCTHANHTVNGISITTTGAALTEVYNHTVDHSPTDTEGHGFVVQNGGASTNVKVRNLDIACDKTGSNIQCVAISGTRDSVDIDRMNYRVSNGALVGKLDSTEYETIGAWKAALTSDATIAGKDTNSTALTPAPDTGEKWYTGPHPIGADGEPFPAYGISIGGIQSRNVAGHPTQL